MKRKRYTEEQIISILKEHQAIACQAYLKPGFGHRGLVLLEQGASPISPWISWWEVTPSGPCARWVS